MVPTQIQTKSKETLTFKVSISEYKIKLEWSSINSDYVINACSEIQIMRIHVLHICIEHNGFVRVFRSVPEKIYN